MQSGRDDNESLQSSWICSTSGITLSPFAVCYLSSFLLSLVKSRQHVYVLTTDRIEFMSWEGSGVRLQSAVRFSVHVINSLSSYIDSPQVCTAANQNVKLQEHV